MLVEKINNISVHFRFRSCLMRNLVWMDGCFTIQRPSYITNTNVTRTVLQFPLTKNEIKYSFKLFRHTNVIL